MKKITKLISTLLIAFALFSGCKNSLSPEKPEEDVSCISFDLSQGYARTALPSYNWDDYTYELYYKVNMQGNWSPETLIVERSNFDRFKKTRVLPKATYEFILKGYSKNMEAGEDDIILQGSSGIRTLTKSPEEGLEVLHFTMYPFSEGTGSVRINITISDVNIIASAKAWILDNSEDAQNVVDKNTEIPGTSVDVTSDGEKKACTYINPSLAAGVTHYAVIWLYDAQGSEVCYVRESMQIMAKKESVSEITIDAPWYNRKNVTITLNKEGVAWTDVDQNTYIILKDTSVTPAVEYKLEQVKDSDNKPTGEFTGNIPAGYPSDTDGKYEIIIQSKTDVITPPSTTSVPTEVRVDTGTYYDVSDDKIYKPSVTPGGTPTETDVNLREVTLPNPDDGVVLSPVGNTEPDGTTTSTVVSNNGGTVLIPEGQDLEVKVEVKPGYKPEHNQDTDGDGEIDSGIDTNNDGIDDHGVIEIGGNKVTVDTTIDPDTKEETNTVTNPPSGTITIENPAPKGGSTTPINITGKAEETYTITLDFDGNNPNTVANSLDYNTTTYPEGEHTITYKVTESKDLLGASSISYLNYVLLGWKKQNAQDSTATFTIPAGTTGNFTMVPVWEEEHGYIYEIKTMTEKLLATYTGTDADYEINSEQKQTAGTETEHTAIVIGTNPVSYKVGNGEVATPSLDGFDVSVTSSSGASVMLPTQTDKTVITVKYTRKSYTYNFDADGGTFVDASHATQTGKHGQTISSFPNPTKTDNAFAGWFIDGDTTEYDFSTGKTFGFKDNNTTFKAKWVVTNASYTVHYLFEKANISGTPSSDSDYESASAAGISGFADETKTADPRNPVTVTPKTAPSGYVTPTSVSQTINSDGSTVINVKYNRRSDIKISYLIWTEVPGAEWTTPENENKKTAEKSVTGKYGSSITPPNLDVTVRPYYYEAVGWKKAGVDTVTPLPTEFPIESISYTYYTSQTKTPYEIHYWKIEGEKAPEMDTTMTEKMIDANAISLPVSANSFTVSQFTSKTPVGYDCTSVTNNEFIATNDSTKNIVNVTITRKSITYTFTTNKGSFAGGGTTISMSKLYGTAWSDTFLTPPTCTGLVFTGWNETPGSFTENKTYTATWKAQVDVNNGSGLTPGWQTTDIAINKSSTALTAAVSSGTWTFKWYDMKDLSTILAEGSSLDFNSLTPPLSKGKHTILLVGILDGIEYTATAEITIQ